MCDILLFSTARRNQARPDRSNDERNGQIVLFTGVRYERHEDPAFAPEPLTVENAMHTQPPSASLQEVQNARHAE